MIEKRVEVACFLVFHNFMNNYYFMSSDWIIKNYDQNFICLQWLIMLRGVAESSVPDGGNSCIQEVSEKAVGQQKKTM